MVRRGLYILILLLLSACPYFTFSAVPGRNQILISSLKNTVDLVVITTDNNDTTKVKRPPQNRMDILDHSIIKEVPKTKRQPKPEKIVTPADTTANNNKPRSKRRPENVERPPDIIRRNN